MSISNPIARNDFIGNGVTISWSYGFKIFNKTELAVSVYNSLTGLITPLILDVDYSVSGVGADNGGSITQVIGISVPAILPATSSITLKRGLALTQTAALKNQGQFFPATIEDALDRQTMILQMQGDIVSASIKLPSTEVPTPLNTILPSINFRKNAYLAFDAAGNLFATALSIATAAVSSFMAPILLATTGDQVKTAIGVKEFRYAIAPAILNQYNLTFPVNPVSYIDGDTYSFRASLQNTGPATFKVGVLAPVALAKKAGIGATSQTIPLSFGDIKDGNFVMVIYNGVLNQFILANSYFDPDTINVRYSSGVLTGTTYVVTPIIPTTIAAASYNAGLMVAFKANATNIGPCNVSVSPTTGPYPLTFASGTPLKAGDIKVNELIVCVFDGISFVVVSNKADANFRYDQSVGTTTTYAITPSLPVTAYAAGQVMVFRAHASNSASATLAVSALAPKAIKRKNGDTLLVNDIRSADMVVVVYDGTDFRIVSNTDEGKQVALAWVYFDASSGSPVIQDSFNVASITDFGVGNWGVNFTVPALNINYAGVVSCAGSGVTPLIGVAAMTTTSSHGVSQFGFLTSSLAANGANANFDSSKVSCVVFGART